MDKLDPAGTVIILIILACSIVALAVFLERIWSLRPSRILPRRFREQVEQLMAQERWHEALMFCRGNDGPAARVLEAGLRAAGSPRRVIRERFEDHGRREAADLESFVGIVGVVGAITPLLGLLGTVWGMINVFRTIQETAGNDAGALAGGISTALYTTFAGLVVAIPAVVAHRLLTSRVDRAVLLLEDQSLRALDLLAPVRIRDDEDPDEEDDDGRNDEETLQ